MPCPAFGDYSYEVIDTKLARQAKPAFVVQLCLYSDLLARLQGRPPERMHVVLGTGERQTFRARRAYSSGAPGRGRADRPGAVVGSCVGQPTMPPVPLNGVSSP